MIIAAIKGYEDLVKLLFNQGADINCSDYEGMNALMYSSVHGHHNIAKFLL